MVNPIVPAGHTVAALYGKKANRVCADVRALRSVPSPPPSESESGSRNLRAAGPESRTVPPAGLCSAPADRRRTYQATRREIAAPWCDGSMTTMEFMITSFLEQPLPGVDALSGVTAKDFRCVGPVTWCPECLHEAGTGSGSVSAGPGAHRKAMLRTWAGARILATAPALSAAERNDAASARGTAQLSGLSPAPTRTARTLMESRHTALSGNSEQRKRASVRPGPPPQTSVPERRTP
jgi:hypothetical protein